MHGKLVFLNRGRSDIPDSDITVLGCTLHSHIKPDYTRLTNDFEQIRDWRVRDHNADHEVDRTWLRGTLASFATTAPGRKVVVATHYAPSCEGTAHPAYEGYELSQYFCSDSLDAMKGWEGAEMVKFWVFGHTHWNARFNSTDVTTVLSN